jgi:hypothetical protein
MSSMPALIRITPIHIPHIRTIRAVPYITAGITAAGVPGTGTDASGAITTGARAPVVITTGTPPSVAITRSLSSTSIRLRPCPTTPAFPVQRPCLLHSRTRSGRPTTDVRSALALCSGARPCHDFNPQWRSGRRRLRRKTPDVEALLLRRPLEAEAPRQRFPPAHLPRMRIFSAARFRRTALTGRAICTGEHFIRSGPQQ